MKCIAILFVCLTVSCAGPTRVSVSYGYGEPVHVGDLLNKASGQPVDLHYASAKVGRTVWESGDMGIDLFVGGFAAMPVDHEASTLAGLVVTPRIRYPVKPGVYAFIAPDLGLAWGDWDKQGGDFNFLVGGQTGFLIKISEHVDMSLSTGLFHISNAGLKKGNPGYNSDLFTVGFEYRFDED